jgi:amino acid transporter
MIIIRSKGKFGTFGGVFVPNILTILGVIMYLRMGWVVGNAGLYNTFIILLIANLITLITAFSMSTIATNMKMKAGGAYYMISRSLGAEVGGSVGIPLYLAQTLVISLYIAGFAESIVNLFPQLNTHGVSLITLICLAILALISSGMVIKTQYMILGIIVLSLISFFSGGPLSFERIHLDPNYAPDYDFWSVFAVFFPAVTGILSGVSLSGDLKDPARSIPAGTILSVIAGAFIYFLIAIWFSLTASPAELTSNNSIMISIARWGPLIYAGIWGATLSSALANILAAPRTLQALATDGIIFKFAGKGRGEQNEPVTATVITVVLVAVVLMMGDLNTIAPVLTMFFLITYGSVNFISFAEGLIKLPGFRPTFRIHWFLPLIGATGCAWVMFVINPLACVTGFAFVIFIYLILKRRQMQKSWGDARRGIWSAVIQYSLRNLGQLKDHYSTWRPNILLIGRNLITKKKLIQIAFGLTQKSGFLTCINLFGTGELDTEKLELESKEFKQMLHNQRVHAFYKNAIVENYLSGQMIASQIHGMGDFMHNTILLDWTESTKGSFIKSAERTDQFKLIRFYSDLNNSLLLLHVNPDEQVPEYKRIDLWWDPGQKNGSFMFLLSYLLASSTYWEKSRLTIKTVVLTGKVKHTHALLEELVEKSRIKAEINVLSPDSEREESLSRQFEKIQKKKHFQNTWISRIRRIVKPLVKVQERGDQTISEMDYLDAESDPESKKVPDDLRETREDDELKEKLSDQIQDIDEFIINQNIIDIIIKNSKQTDLVMLGFNIPAKGKEKQYIEKMEALLEKLPDTLLINCPFDFELFE